MLDPLDELIRRVQAALSDDLRRPPWRGAADPLAGHCYVASEALYHLLGGARSGLRPQQVEHEGASHWYLRGGSGRAYDPTAGQFRRPPPADCEACGRGFLTAGPSRRARVVMGRVRRAPGGREAVARAARALPGPVRPNPGSPAPSALAAFLAGRPAPPRA